MYHYPNRIKLSHQFIILIKFNIPIPYLLVPSLIVYPFIIFNIYKIKVIRPIETKLKY